MLVFLLLNIPTPKGWKGKLVKFLGSSELVKNIVKAQVGFCLLAGLFFVDSYLQESKFKLEKEAVRAKDSYASGKISSK